MGPCTLQPAILGQGSATRRLWRHSIRSTLGVLTTFILWDCDGSPQPHQVLISNVSVADPVDALLVN